MFANVKDLSIACERCFIKDGSGMKVDNSRSGGGKVKLYIVVLGLFGTRRQRAVVRRK